MTPRLRGVLAPILTPFELDLAVARDLWIDHARRLLREGCVGLVPFGTTGEALSLGIEERLELLDSLAASEIGPSRLVPGTGLTNLPDTVRLTQAAVDLGCAGVLVLPPFYYKDVAHEGLFAYFAHLIERVRRDELRIFLYHIPQVAGVGVPVPVVRRLREAFPQQIVGIKDSTGDANNLETLLEIEGLIVYPGSELALLTALKRGAAGCISATANVQAQRIAQVIRFFDEGSLAEAREALESARRVRERLQRFRTIPALKGLLALTDRDTRWVNVRPPLQSLDDRAKQALVRLGEDEGLVR